jgi:hypothetical protein
MTNFSTLSPASTYQDLLNIDANGQGLQTYPTQIQDGLGNSTNLSLWLGGFNIDRGLGVFSLDGVPLTATAMQLNSLTNVTGADYLLYSPNADLPNANVLQTATGLSLVPGLNTMTLTPTNDLGGIEAITGSGWVSRTTTDTYATRTYQSNGSITITNPGGIAGNPIFSVVDDTNIQRVNVDSNGIRLSTRPTLNFIPGNGAGITVQDNIGANRTDIIISAIPTPPFSLTVQGTADQINVVTNLGISTVSLVDEVIIPTSVQAGNMKLVGNSLISVNANGNISLDPNGTGVINALAPFIADSGSFAAPSLSFTGDTNTGFFSIVSGNVGFSSDGSLTIVFGDTGIEMLGSQSVRWYNPTNTNYVGFVGGNAGADVIWTLPTTDSTGNQALVSDGAGVLSWADFGGIQTINGTPNQIVANTVGDTTTIGLTDSVQIVTSLSTPEAQIGNILINTNQMVVQNAGGSIELIPNGAGSVILSGLSYPVADGTNGQVLTTNGAGVLSFNTVNVGVTSITGTANQITASASTGAVTLSLPANVDITTSLDVANINITGNTLSATNIDGDINFTPNGTGNVILSGLVYPNSDGTNGQVLTTDGAGNLSFTSLTPGGVTSITGSVNQIVASASTGSVTLSLDTDVEILNSLDVADITMSSNTISTVDPNQNLVINPNGTGNVILGSDSNSTSLLWTNTTNTNLVGFQAGVSTGNITWTLPVSDSTGTQALVSNGSGVLSWASTGSGSPGGSNTQVQFNNAGAFGGSADFTWDGSEVSSPYLRATTGATFGGISIYQIASDWALNCAFNDLYISAADNIRLLPDTAGYVYIDANRWPAADGTAGQTLVTDGSGNLSWSTGGGGKVLQVVQAVKTDTFSTSSTSFVDITGMSVSITPSSSSSKVLVLVDIKFNSGGNTAQTVLVRGSTQIYIGDAAGSRTRASAMDRTNETTSNGSGTIMFLDSPNTTSSTTYKIQGLTNAGTFYVNRSALDTDAASASRTASSITLMEIGA